MSVPTPAPPWRGASAPPPAPTGPAWRSPPPGAPYRPRWRKLALVAGLGLLALAVVTWVVFWLRPPAPARLVVVSANYDRTLAVAPNPYGKADARELAALAKLGSWLGTRSRLAGGPATSLTRVGLPDLSAAREKCVVVFVAAHGGRDRDGPFLFPEDTTGEPAERVRFRTLLDQLAKLPADRQKLLIIDATREPAFTDLGLVHNDFAGGVEELDADIAAVPNLAVYLSTGLDERSWSSPEWGTSSFAHFAMSGLNGAADADGDRRVTAGELVAFVTPRVSDWARDHRGARQVPILLPKADGEARARAMHLVMADGAPASSAPEPFEPPPELEEQWREYRSLATATPPPTAYTPHLWRQYEAWTLRHEQHILAGDADGAKVARGNASEARRKIEAARTLEVSPQTLTLQAAVGGQPYVAEVPASFKAGIRHVAGKPPADRAKEWATTRDAAGDTEANRLLWCRALIEWTAEDPLPRLPVARDLVPMVTDGLAFRPAEVNFLAMLARHLPPASKAEVIGPLLTRILRERLSAEVEAGGQSAIPSPLHDRQNYPFTEVVYRASESWLVERDAARRNAEDLCFATDEARWKSLLAPPPADVITAHERRTRHWRILDWHCGAHTLIAFGEWSVRPRDAFQLDSAGWKRAHAAATALGRPYDPKALDLLDSPIAFVRSPDRGLGQLSQRHREDFEALLRTKPEFDAATTPRDDAVKWWITADAVLTAPPPAGAADRGALTREFRRVSRQLLVTGETRPEPLPEVTPAKAREVAFEAAKRRGELLLGRFGGSDLIRALSEVRPGEDANTLSNRLEEFAIRADGRQSLAAFGSRCGELFDAVAALATKPDGHLAADRWVRISPAHAPVTDAPIDRVRRERVRGYLAFQAQRTFSDHWYGEGDTRYYQLAAQRLASDAGAITAALTPTDKLFEPYLGAEPLFPVTPKLPARISVTDEPTPTVRVPFSANPVAGVSGFPVFWTDPKARTPVSTTPGDASFTRSLTRPAWPQPLTPKAQTEALQISGFFRGRTLNAATPVDFYAVPDRAAVRTPLPQTVDLAVRADLNALKRYGFGTGAVAVVLDCSGSMARNPKDPTSAGNYPAAVDALAKLLKELPPGTTLNVWTFGQRTTGVKSPEETIREVLPPTELPLDAGEIVEKVLADVRGLEPWHESPVTRAVVRAKDRIAGVPVPFKAVVLISDAVDTRFAADPEYGEKKRSIGDVLKAEFTPASVALGVVAFGVHKDDQPAQAEFKTAEKLAPAGKFVPPEKANELIAWVRTGLNPHVRFTLQPLTSDGPPSNLMAGTPEHDNWYRGKLAPGGYTLRVFGAPAFASDIRLSPGDRLLLDLTEDRGALSLKRHWYADSAEAVAKDNAPPNGPWRMALLQSGAKNGKLDLLAAIDANPVIADRLSFTRIGDVWFDVVPSVPKAEPVAVRWRADGGLPSPAWALDSPGWPLFPGTTAHASPKVSAWWSREPFAAHDVLLGTAVDGGIVGMRPRAVTVSGAAVTVESVELEEHEVDVAPGERAKRLCLVVRVTHPEGNPVFARPADITATGRELRLYHGANKTTSLFWWPGLTEADAKAKVTALEFVVLNDALRAAKDAGRHLTLTAPAPK